MSGPGFQIPGDLGLSADGRELLLVGGSRITEQSIRTGAEVWQGFWAYDESVGLPMLSSILVKGADLRVVTQVFRDWLATRAGVTRVTACACALDRVARSLSVQFAVLCEDGTTLQDELAFAVG